MTWRVAIFEWAGASEFLYGVAQNSGIRVQIIVDGWICIHNIVFIDLQAHMTYFCTGCQKSGEFRACMIVSDLFKSLN